MLSLMYQFLDQQQANVVFCMLVCIPISYLLSILPNKYLTLAITISVTYTIQSFLFPIEKYYLWAQQAAVYILLVICPRKRVGLIVFVQSFIFLSVIQLRRMYAAYGQQKLGITGILMMQTMMYISVGFNYQNGGKPQDKLRPDQLRRAIKNKPDILTYIGYMWYTPACLVGPVYEYNDYKDYINRVNDFEYIPNTLIAVFKQFGVFLICTGSFMAASKLDMEFLTSQTYKGLPLILRLLVIPIPVWRAQIKYISAWSLAIASVKASGFGYQKIKDQKTGKQTSNFQRIQMNSIFAFFFDPSFKVKADSWNISVQQMLKKYIYEPVFYSKDASNEKNRKRQQVMGINATVCVSALWHGLYPAYYITFIHWALVLQVTQEVFRLRRKSPKFQKMYSKYGIGSFLELLYSTYYMAYFGQIFILMTSDRYLIPLTYTYFIPGICIYLIWFFGCFLGFINKYGKSLQKSSQKTQPINGQQKKQQQAEKTE